MLTTTGTKKKDIHKTITFIRTDKNTFLVWYSQNERKVNSKNKNRSKIFSQENRKMKHKT